MSDEPGELKAENERLRTKNEQLRQRVITDEKNQTSPLTRRRVLRGGMVGALSLLAVGTASADRVFPIEEDPQLEKIRLEVLDFYLLSDSPSLPVGTARAVMWLEDGDLP